MIEHHVALWDVLAAATRSGSLDAAIAEDAIPNNFRAFFRAHPRIKLIGFNGTTAAKLYNRHVLPKLPLDRREIARLTLPSTSWSAREPELSREDGPLVGVLWRGSS